jgi:hypothetical protein
MAILSKHYQNEGMGLLRTKKKRRNQNRISFLIALLWMVHSGGEREPAGKKQGEQKSMRVFLLFWSHFSRERPHYETRGGHSRPDTAQGPSSTCIRPAQGTGSRPCGPFPELVWSQQNRPTTHQPTT